MLPKYIELELELEDDIGSCLRRVSKDGCNGSYQIYTVNICFSTLSSYPMVRTICHDGPRRQVLDVYNYPPRVCVGRECNSMQIRP